MSEASIETTNSPSAELKREVKSIGQFFIDGLNIYLERGNNPTEQTAILDGINRLVEGLHSALASGKTHLPLSPEKHEKTLIALAATAKLIDPASSQFIGRFDSTDQVTQIRDLIKDRLEPSFRRTLTETSK